MLHLPDVTLVAADNGACAELARLAVRDCLSVARFGAQIINLEGNWDGCSDERLDAGRDGYCEWLWYELPRRLTTSHFLIVQWDSWILNPSLWDDRWLSYDYIGAQWPEDYPAAPGGIVGNGGFSLRSTRLAQAVADQPDKYPLINTPAEDISLSFYHREKLEQDGFRWASKEDADLFAFEMTSPKHDTFGFHGSMNFPLVLHGERYKERIKSIQQTHYMQTHAWFKVMMLPSVGIDEGLPDVNEDLRTMDAWHQIHQPFELEWWKEHVPTGHLADPGFTTQWDEVKQFIEITGDVLDIGCGPRPPFAPCAVIEPLALAYQGIVPPEYWEGVTVYAQAAEQLIHDLKADTVICWNAIDHAIGWRSILDNMLAYGRPGARFAIATDFYPPFVGHPGFPRHEFMTEIRARFNIHKEREPFGRALALLMTARK